MSGIKFRIDYIIFGGLASILFLSILSSDFQDPTVFNQLYPSVGIQNWTGLIGALIGGSLLEIFGPSTILLPWLIIRISLHKPRTLSVLTGYYYAFVIVFLLSIFYEFVLNSGMIKTDKTEFYWQNGYAGKLGLIWLEESTHYNLSLFALSSMLIFSIVRMRHVISPIPFFKGFFFGCTKYIFMFFKAFPAHSKTDVKKTNLVISKSQPLLNKKKDHEQLNKI